MRNAAERQGAQTGESRPVPVLHVPDERIYQVEPVAPGRCGPRTRASSRSPPTAGEAKAVLHAQRYLTASTPRPSTGSTRAPASWCVHGRQRLEQVGPQRVHRSLIRGASALLHDARFDPHERMAIAARERVNVLCMAPTEYRVIAKRGTLTGSSHLRGLVAAGEALNPEVLRAWHEHTGLWIRDGYGQTETGQLTGMPLGIEAVPGSMGRALPGWACRSSTASSC